MSIADTIHRPGVVILDAWEKPTPYGAAIRRGITTHFPPHYVRCDAVANGVWRDHLPQFNPPRHKPTWHDNAPYRPPFDDLWIEWTLADELRSVAPMTMTDVAVSLHAIPVEDWHPLPQGLPDDVAVGIICETFVKSTAGYGPIVWVGTDNVFIGRDGRFINAVYIKETLHKGLSVEDFQARFIQFVRPAFSAVALMNCKNVALVPTPPPRRPKKSKPDRTPRIQFHTIQVPGMDYGGGGTTEPSHQDMARHYVRGHFKTYTADAPLMGKAVGTYWWGWQARGAKKNGIVVSDYEVA